MKLYVYQLGDKTYDVGLVQQLCEQRGTIVEEWTVSTLEDARFLASHGSNYGNISSKVSKLADLIGELVLSEGSLEGLVAVNQADFDMLLAEKKRLLEQSAARDVENAHNQAKRRIEQAREAHALALKAENERFDELWEVSERERAKLTQSIKDLRASHRQEVRNLTETHNNRLKAVQDAAEDHRVRLITAHLEARAQAVEDARLTAVHELNKTGLFSRLKLALKLVFKRI